MVRGIDKFREFFTGYEGNYVIIGGTACEMHEEIYAQTPRATKDIDIILIVEALSSDFAAKFWEFVKTAGYRQRNKGTGNGECRHEYYRFKEPGNPDFPYQIELFSRNIGVVKFPDDAHITPIPVDDDLSWRCPRRMSPAPRPAAPVPRASPAGYFRPAPGKA